MRKHTDIPAQELDALWNALIAASKQEVPIDFFYDISGKLFSIVDNITYWQVDSNVKIAIQDHMQKP